MHFMSVIALFVHLIFFTQPSGHATEKVTANATSSCEIYETPCTFGCCPYAEGVCCMEGWACCQHGQTCIPIIDVCIGLESKNDTNSLVSSKSTPVREVTSCPAGTTPCGKDRCCPYERGVCCRDGDHCCPHGYKCDIPGKRCLKKSNNELKARWSDVRTAPLPVPFRRFQNILPNKSVSKNGFGLGYGQCCTAFYGYTCCPDDYPFCFILGCHN